VEGLSIKTYTLEDILDIVCVYKNEMIRQGSPIRTSNNDCLDEQIERDFIDDIDPTISISKDILVKRVKRYQRIVKETKQKYNFTCQICGETFLMDNGEKYCEAHHITFLSLDGSQDEQNIIILCANHHRMFHYAQGQVDISDLLDNKRTVRIETQVYEVIFK